MRRRGQPASMSYRQHMLRLVADAPALYAGLDIAVGRQADVALSVWEEAFLPQKLHDLLLGTRVVRGDRRLPLIRSERVLLSGQVAAPRAAAPDWAARYALLGLALGAAFALLGGAQLAKVARRACCSAWPTSCSGSGSGCSALRCAT